MVLCRLLYWLFALQRSASPQCCRFILLCSAISCHIVLKCHFVHHKAEPGASRASHSRAHCAQAKQPGTNSPSHHQLPKPPWARHSLPHPSISWRVKSSCSQSKHLPKTGRGPQPPSRGLVVQENRERGTDTPKPSPESTGCARGAALGVQHWFVPCPVPSPEQSDARSGRGVCHPWGYWQLPITLAHCHRGINHFLPLHLTCPRAPFKHLPEATA